MDSSSEQSDFIIDPNADTIIILKHQATEFAAWDESAEFPHPPFVLPDSPSYRDSSPGTDTEMKETREQDTSENIIEDPECASQDEPETRFHVSSRHLSLASTYFHRLLSKNWDQHHLRDALGHILIHEEGWTVPSFARLMYIIHGKARAVPRTLELVELAETAHMIDYYDCGEVVEAYSTAWINYMKTKYRMPRSYGKELVLWLWVSWVFSEQDIFKRITLIAISECESEIQTMGLPIPEIVINAIESKRQYAVKQILTEISTHLTDLLAGKAGCNLACASMHIGFFTKALHVRGLQDPPCAPPYLGISVDMLIQHLREFEYPRWCVGRPTKGYNSVQCSYHQCDEQRFLTNLATKVQSGVAGLKLTDFPSQMGR